MTARLSPGDQRELDSIRAARDAALALAEEARAAGDQRLARVSLSTALLLSNLETRLLRAIAYTAAYEIRLEAVRKQLS